MFIAWRSVTEAKNKILFLCYLSYMLYKPNSTITSRKQQPYSKPMPCDIFQTTMKTKLMIMYIFVFINANVLFSVAIFFDCMLLLLLFSFFYDGSECIFCTAGNLCAIPCLLWISTKKKTERKREKKRNTHTQRINVN